MTAKSLAVVTGGAGFIGSHMVDLLLEQGFRVHVIDNLVSGREENLAHLKSNPDVAVEFRDLLDYGPSDSFFDGASYIFHFAGIGDIVPSIEQPMKYMAANVQGTVHALECARAQQRTLKKMVYAASSSCYGLARELPTTEHAPISTEYPYALSKYQGEQALLHWGKVYKLPVNAIRIFNAYGTRSRTTGAYGAVIGVFLKQKLEGKPFTVVGDGTQKRDFLYATDVARAFLAVAERGHLSEVYNLGAGNPQSVNRLVELLGGDVTYIPKRPGEPDVTWADISKIQAHTGWKPLVSFEQGIQKVLDNIDYWRNAPLWDPASIEKATKVWFDSLSGRTM